MKSILRNPTRKEKRNAHKRACSAAGMSAEDRTEWGAGEEAKFAIVAGAALLVTVVLPFTGAEFGFIAPVLIMLLHIGLAFWGAIVVVRLKRGVYRATAGWILAILVLPWIDVLVEPLFASSDAEPWFVCRTICRFSMNSRNCCFPL